MSAIRSQKEREHITGVIGEGCTPPWAICAMLRNGATVHGRRDSRLGGNSTAHGGTGFHSGIRWRRAGGDVTWGLATSAT